MSPNVNTIDPFRYIQSKWVYGYRWPIEAMRKLNPKPNSSLLLMGSGFGKTAVMAAEHFHCQVVGADIVPLLAKKAEKLARERGLANRVKFLTLNLEEPYLELDVDTIFFESILSFLKSPKDVMNYYSKRVKPHEKIGVLELTIPDDAATECSATLVDTFGNAALFRDDAAWLKIFNEAELEKIDSAEKSLGLARKFWDDLRQEPLGTLIDLTKTIYMSYTDKSAHEAMLRFRRFFKDCSNKMMSRFYLLRRPN